MQLLITYGQCPPCSWVAITTPPPRPTPLVGILRMTLQGVEYPFGNFESAVLAVPLPIFLCISSVAEHGKLKSPWLFNNN